MCIQRSGEDVRRVAAAGAAAYRTSYVHRTRGLHRPSSRSAGMDRKHEDELPVALVRGTRAARRKAEGRAPALRFRDSVIQAHLSRPSSGRAGGGGGSLERSYGRGEWCGAVWCMWYGGPRLLYSGAGRAAERLRGEVWLVGDFGSSGWRSEVLVEWAAQEDGSSLPWVLGWRWRWRWYIRYAPKSQGKVVTVPSRTGAGTRRSKNPVSRLAPQRR